MNALLIYIVITSHATSQMKPNVPKYTQLIEQYSDKMGVLAIEADSKTENSEMSLTIEQWIYITVIAIVVLTIVLYILYRIIKFIKINKSIELAVGNIEETKKASVQKILADHESTGLDRSNCDDIIGLKLEDLIKKLKCGELNAIDALGSYQLKAMDVNDRTNCVTAWIDDALDWAKHLDGLKAEERGPLHGVPVSIKECYDITGTHSTAGMIKFYGKKASKNSVVVELVKKLGGVPFCKTNVPQSMYSMQCSNPLYGTTTNPEKTGREAGGSSGGEGALLGGGGSIVGVGSDIGGSLRNPAAFCGVYSLRPTHGRHLSQLGVVASTDYEPVGVPVVGGFMSRDASTLVHCWKETWMCEDSPQKVDTSLVPLPWNEELFEKKPRIGYYTSDDILAPVPGAQRAVTEAVELLRKAGYEVMEFQSPPMAEIINLFNGFVMADKNNALFNNLSWDRYDSSLNGVWMALMVYKIPYCVKKYLLTPILRKLTVVPLVVLKLFTHAGDIWKQLNHRDSIKRDYLASMEIKGVDVLLTPGQMMPAPPTGKMGTFAAVILPYIPWNVLNFPAGIVPITTYSNQDAKSMDNYPTDDIVCKMMKEMCQDSEGLPLAVQVVGKPNMDEQVLRVMCQLQKSVELVFEEGSSKNRRGLKNTENEKLAETKPLLA